MGLQLKICSLLYKAPHSGSWNFSLPHVASAHIFSGNLSTKRMSSKALCITGGLRRLFYYYGNNFYNWAESHFDVWSGHDLYTPVTKWICVCICVVYVVMFSGQAKVVIWHLELISNTCTLWYVVTRFLITIALAIKNLQLHGYTH